jgi:hypothetical protein
MSKEKKESVRLEDFINDVIVAFEIDKEYIPQPEVRERHFCEKCDRSYSEGTKFCSEDGSEIKSETYEVQSREYEKFVRDIFYDFSQEETIPESFPYEYVDSIEKRGDGDGYYMNFIFKRKSDGKFFYYTSYDGRIEEDTLDETKQKVTVKWDFEKYFS